VSDSDPVNLRTTIAANDAPQACRTNNQPDRRSDRTARPIANAIARLPELVMQRRGFYPRGGHDRWKPSRPCHVALEDSYIRTHWEEIDALQTQQHSVQRRVRPEWGELLAPDREIIRLCNRGHPIQK
jgi:hypothetical protein